MTVESTTNRAQYATNGTTGPWTVPWQFYAKSDVQVIYADANGNETVLGDSDYSVTGTGDESGGTVTTTTAYGSGGTITLLMAFEALQEVDYTETDAFPAETHERALDLLTRLVQQTQEVVGRAIVIAPSENNAVVLPNAAGRANKMLGFDGDGDPTVLVPVDGTAASVLVDLGDTTSDSLNSALVGFKQSGVGAVGTSLREIATREISLFDFLSSAQKADVLAQTALLDVSTALNAAIAEAVAQLGKKIKLPTGKYRIESTIDFPVDWPIEIVGEGIDATIISVVGAVNGFDLVGSISNHVVKSGFSDLRITGSGGALVGVNMSWCTKFHMRNVRINGFTHAVRVEQGWAHTYDHVTIDGNSSHGMILSDEANDIALNNCELYGNTGAGLYADGCRSVNMFGGTLETNDYGLYVTSTTAGTTHSVSLFGVYIEGNTTNEVRVTKDSGSDPANVNLVGCYFVCLTSKASIAVRLLYGNGVNVDSCHFSVGTATYSYSLYLNDSATLPGIKFSGNTDASTNGIYRGTGTYLQNQAVLMPRAVGKFTLTGTSITLTNLYNCVSVTRVSAGLYEVTLRETMANLEYIITCSAENGASYTTMMCSPVPPASTTVFRIQTTDAAATAADARNVFFSVWSTA